MPEPPLSNPNPLEAETERGDTEHLRTADSGELGGTENRVPGLTVLYHPELARVGERAVLSDLASGMAPLSRLEPLFAQPGSSQRRPLALPRLSRSPLRLYPAQQGALELDLGEGRIPVRAEGEPLPDRRRFERAELERGVVLLLAGRIVLLLHLLDPLAQTDDSSDNELIGESPAMVRLRRGIERVADLQVPVLVRGETGTGKELVARALHRASPRSEGSFVAVNMAAVPPSLAAAELFGAGRGAFTGADRERQGHFRRARGGTLFLDEIGDTPQDVQPLLLRALESGEVQPLGGGSPEAVDVRLVSATDLALESAIADGDFRAPLLHRLAGFTLHAPPLRERREDMGRLLLHFLRRELQNLDDVHRLDAKTPWLPATVVDRLARAPWPGNVRQLANVVRQLVIAYRGTDEVPRHPPELDELLEDEPQTASPPPPFSNPSTPRRPADIREDELVAALRANRWRPKAAADQLGVPPSSLYERIARSPRVRKASDIDRQELEACALRYGGDVERMVDALEVSEQALRRRMGRLGIDLDALRRSNE